MLSRRHRRALRAPCPLFPEPRPPLAGPSHRSFVPGFTPGLLLGGAGGGGGGDPGGVIPEEGVLTDFFADNGATWPNYGLHMLPGLHDPGTNRTYHTWEGFTASGRRPFIRYYDHATGQISPMQMVRNGGLTDDDHGNPSIELDHESHLWIADGAHASSVFVSSTSDPITSGVDWVARSAPTATITYPKIHAVGTALHMMYRNGDTTKRTLAIAPSTSLASGVVAWGTPTILLDLGANTWTYAGNSVIRGTEIHTVIIRSDGDTIRENLYYIIFDTAAGSVSNWDKSVTIASGDLPVDATEANADFRIFEHTGGNGGAVAGLAFDTNDLPHVLFTDGSGTSYALKHMTVSGGAWTTPEALDTLDTRFEMGAIGPLPDGRMEVVYPKDETASFARGGTAILRREMSAAGVWAAAHTLLTASGKALSEVNPVRDAHTDARFTWCEIANSHLDANAGGLRSYIWGTSGLLRQGTYSPPDATGNLTLGTDNLVLGTDNLTIDTTA